MTLTAVLFTGGQSRRMGVDKATLEICGQPLWARQLGVLRELAPASLFVSARVQPGWCPAEVPVVFDRATACGPLGGLAQSLHELTTTHLLALAVDMPRMTAAHLRALWAAAGSETGVIPEICGDFEPMCAIYPSEALIEVNRALASQDFSLQSVVRRLLARNQMCAYNVIAKEASLYQNINTPLDFSKFASC